MGGTQCSIAKWVPDSQVQLCHRCSKPFDFIHRKHHCRICGNIFCNDCTRYRVDCKSIGTRKRVCNVCYLDLAPFGVDSLERIIRNMKNVSKLFWSTDEKNNQAVTLLAQMERKLDPTCPQELLSKDKKSTDLWVVIHEQGLNIRSNPSLDAEIVGLLSFKSLVEALETMSITSSQQVWVKHTKGWSCVKTPSELFMTPLLYNWEHVLSSMIYEVRSSSSDKEKAVLHAVETFIFNQGLQLLPLEAHMPIELAIKFCILQK